MGDKDMRFLVKGWLRGLFVGALAVGCCASQVVFSADAQKAVKIGLNIPISCPYRVQGIDQKRAAQLAVEEINTAGGILGRPIELIQTDSQSKADVTTQNVTKMIERDGVEMVFGGAASSVAIAAGKVAQKKGVPFFGTLTYSTETTGT
jgi:branched-chain amino acid transport system substrate-binding protein